MRGAMPIIRFFCFLGVILSLSSSASQALAGVRVSMADDLEKGRNFMVTTEIYYHKPEGFHVKKIDRAFLTAGRTKNITVLAVWPLLYSHTFTYAFHPAFYTDSAKSDKTPFALRTVELPTLRPQSWRHLLDSGDPPKGRGGSIIPGLVNHHFYVILSDYLPAFDRACIKEDLHQYLPLLRDLTAFAHRERVYKKSAVAVTPAQGPIPRQDDIEPQPETLERYRSEMDERLEEITAWLALEQDRRAAMHDWMDHFHKPEYVFREIMSDADRTRLLQWLDRSIEGATERTLHWTSQATGLVYTANFVGRISGKQGDVYGVNLTVDLNPILGLRNNRRYLKECYQGFYRNEDGSWNVRKRF